VPAGSRSWIKISRWSGWGVQPIVKPRWLWQRYSVTISIFVFCILPESCLSSKNNSHGGSDSE